MSKPETPQCSCSWPDCAWLSEQIEKHAPDTHVWKGNWHRWQEHKMKPSSLFERMLFLATMCQHVPGIQEAFQGGRKGKNRKHLVLARHHFPISIYNYLVRQRITTLLSEARMQDIQANNTNDRLMDECNRVGHLANFLKTNILSPGKLLDDFIARENECLEAKAHLFVCPPTTTRQQVMDELKVIVQQEKERKEKEEQENEQRAREELLRTANVLASVAAPVPAPVQATAPVPVQATAPPVVPSPLPDSNDTSRESPIMIPSAEQCIAKIQSKIEEEGVEKASTSKNFIDCLRVLRFVYNHVRPIPLPACRYICPCKDDDRDNSTCATFRFTARFYREGMYCEPCQKRQDRASAKRSKLNKSNLSLTTGRRVESLPREHLIQMVTEQRKINRNLKRKVQRAMTKKALRQGGGSAADSDSSNE